MVIMSIDYGERRTGIALCDKSEVLSYPFCVIEEENIQKLINKIIEISIKNKVEIIVIGKPLNMNGTLSERSKLSENLKSELELLIKLPIILFDERLSSVQANNILKTGKNNFKKNKKIIDAVAASLILENFLLYRKNTIC